jgi:XTP/dITP diphosphohydrolase
VAQVTAKLCSQNAHKLEELRAALPGWRIELLEADDWPEEDGTTYYQNARTKADFGRSVAGPGVWTIGEDSGIECDALAGGPGVQSARWATAGAQAEALLERLAGETNRRARMVAELVCLSPGGAEFRGAGVLDGTIAGERRGEGGFGYDPVFVPKGFDRTVAELGDDWKRANSHRARAAQALREAVADREMDTVAAPWPDA